MKRLFALLVAIVASFSMMAEVVIVESPATDAVYRLPMERGVAVVARMLTPVNLGVAMRHNQRDFCAWQLSATQKSDVVAPREGTVESAEGDEVVILHPDGLYTKLMLVEGVSVSEGDRLEKGDKVGTASASSSGTWRVWMATYYLEKNPDYGTPALSGKSEYLVRYVNPIFTTKNKCKVLLTDGGAYTVKARTWCWFWE